MMVIIKKNSGRYFLMFFAAIFFISFLILPVKMALAKTVSECYKESSCLYDSTTKIGGRTSEACCNCLADTESGKTLGCILNDITANLLLNIIVPLLFIAVTIIFLYGVMNYVRHGGDKVKREEGLKYIIWGLIGLFVMASVWGLVNIIDATLNLKQTAPTVPTFQFNR